MRKQLSSTTRCWSSYIYKKMFKGNPPVDFNKSVEIIDTMHREMIDHLMKRQRPIQLRRTLGFLELTKTKILSPLRYIPDWKKTRAAGRMIKQANHHTSGYVYSIKFRFAEYSYWRLFKFDALRTHNRELTKRILNKDVQ